MPDATLLDEYIELDRAILGTRVELLADAAERFASRVSACDDTPAHSRERCVLDGLFGEDGLLPEPNSAPPAASSVTYALTEERGTCAGLVATVLAITERAPLFDAVMFRDHVALVSRTDPSAFYDVLDGGRALSQPEIARHHATAVGGVRRVSGSGFRAYYLDNLGARLAQENQLSGAEEAFLAAFALAPDDSRILYNYGSFLASVERYAEAVNFLGQAISAGWNDSSAFVNRGVANWRLGNVDDARVDFERAIVLDPTNREAATNLRMLVNAEHIDPVKADAND